MQRNEVRLVDTLEDALTQAIKDKDAHLAKDLCKRILDEIQSGFVGKRLLRQDEKNNSFLHLGLRRGVDDVEMLFPYYRGEPDLALLCDDKGRSLFWLAVSRSKREIAEKLLDDYKKRAEQEAKQAIEQESEQESEQETKQSVRNALLKLLKSNNKGVTPIHLAAKSADPEWLPWLITNLELQDSTAELLNSLDEQGNSPLQYACHRKRPRQIFFLLAHGVEVDASIVNYLEKHRSLFSTEDFTISISEKRRILDYIYLQMIDNDERANDEDKKDETNNEEKIKLISFYKELASQTSLIDAIKANILTWEVEDALDDIQREILGMDDLQQKRQKLRLFRKDRADLRAYINNLDAFAPNFSIPVDEMNIVGWFNVLSIFFAGAGLLIFLVAGFTSPIITLPVIIISSVALGVGLLFQMAGYNAVTFSGLRQIRMAEADGLPLLEQAKDILAKLEKVNPDAQLVDAQTIMTLKECVDYKQAGYWETMKWWMTRYNDYQKHPKFGDLKDRVKTLKPLIEKISQAMIEQNQPISTIENVQQAPSVSATEEIFSELGVEAVANSADISPLTIASNKDESSSAPSSPRVMSLFAQPPQSRYAIEEEEGVPLLIAEEGKPSLSVVIQQD